jgi:hypothetical protein
VSTERAGVDDPPPPAGAVQRTGGTGRGVAVVRPLPESLRNGPGIYDGDYQKAITLLEGKIRRAPARMIAANRGLPRSRASSADERLTCWFRLQARDIRCPRWRSITSSPARGRRWCSCTSGR